MASLNTYLSSLFAKPAPQYSNLSGLKGTTPKLSLTPSKSAVMATPSPLASNASASVSPTSPTPSPAKSTAQTQYVNSISSTPQLGTPEYTQYLLNKASSLGINTGYNPQPSTSPAAAPPVAPSPEPTPMDKYLESYRDYLAQYADSLKPSDELKAARSRLGEIQSKIDERSLKARRDYEATLDTPGGTLGGARESAAVINRRYASELADLGVAESGAARGLSALNENASAYSSALKTALDLGKPLEIAGNLYDPMSGKLLGPKEAAKGSEPFTLSEGQQRYEVDPKTGQYKLIASVPKTYAPKDGSGEDVASTYKSDVASSGRQAISTMLKIAEDNPQIFGRSAALPLPSALRSDAYRNYQAQIDSLKGNIIPAALSAMREASKTGGALGQVSDRENAWLASSLGALSMAQDPKTVVEQLKQIDASLARWQNAVVQYGGGTGAGNADAEYQAYLKAISE